MESSSIFINHSPLQSRPQRSFLRQPFSDLTNADQTLFERFGQGPLVAVSYSCIHHAFEDHARQQPGAIAAIHGDQQITYRELNEAADRLAIQLIAHGVNRGDHVGLFLERSIPMLVGILGALKAGAAYVPQDARITPAPQLLHVMTAARTRVVLTLSHLNHFIPTSSPNQEMDQPVLINLDEFLAQIEPSSKIAYVLDGVAQRRQLSNEQDTCFVLFTSGTTGRPNGVQVSHQNLCNILLTDPGSLGMRPGRRVSQILNIAFDMAAWEILGALSHGATLVIRGKDIQATVEAVDVVVATPSILGALDATRCRAVKAVAVAGEPCPRPLADQWSEFATFYNSCGPTEVTIVNTMQAYSMASEALTIGKPTPNNTVYILNENHRPCTIGEIGEMWAGGDCVSKGYLSNDELNSDRYRPDPFLGGGRKMFRTRDLGRWTRNGELEHFGRTDDQVKIRGFRVELDSVSGALESVPACVQAVTLKLDSHTLVAFVRPDAVDITSCKTAVAALLPYYCAPSIIMPLKDFPMTSRGKVDKRALTILAVKELEKLAETLVQTEEVPS